MCRQRPSKSHPRNSAMRSSKFCRFPKANFFVGRPHTATHVRIRIGSAIVDHSARLSSGKSTDPLFCFRTAETFSMGATILARRANLDWPILHVPAGVLAGLAVELYLKCLLLIQVGQFPATHNFKVLFGQLPRVTRIRLEKKHDESKATHPDFAAARETSLDPNDLMSVLDAAQESFTELRYPYEQ